MRINELHLKAPGNWINDPNGFIYYKGKYHLFYQYFPYGTRWGTMHWGHAISEDLVTWEHLPIALFPTKDYDANGIFSGSAIEKDGKMYIYYTAEKYVSENPEDIHIPHHDRALESQAMIISEDGYSFDNWNAKEQIIPIIEDGNIGDSADTRDPKVWKENDTFYMCLGSTHRKEEGVLLIYRSKDAKKWELYTRAQGKEFGDILECPDLFCVDNEYLLMSSPIGIAKDKEYAPQQTIFRRVNWNGESGNISINGNYQFVDYGMDAYAPQSNIDSKGRRTFICWIRMPLVGDVTNNPAAEGNDWIGMMSLPRVVEIVDGTIYTRVHPNVRHYFDDVSCDQEKNYRVYQKNGNKRICTSLMNDDIIEIDGYVISMIDGCIVTDRSKRIPQGTTIHMNSKTPYVGEACDLEIYYERNLIEIFVNDGKYVITNVLY